MKEEDYSRWMIYYSNYADLCREYGEEKCEENWEQHYERLQKRREDDILGW